MLPKVRDNPLFIFVSKLTWSFVLVLSMLVLASVGGLLIGLSTFLLMKREIFLSSSMKKVCSCRKCLRPILGGTHCRTCADKKAIALVSELLWSALKLMAKNCRGWWHTNKTTMVRLILANSGIKKLMFLAKLLVGCEIVDSQWESEVEDGSGCSMVLEFWLPEVKKKSILIGFDEIMMDRGGDVSSLLGWRKPDEKREALFLLCIALPKDDEKELWMQKEEEKPLLFTGALEVGGGKSVKPVCLTSEGMEIKALVFFAAKLCERSGASAMPKVWTTPEKENCWHIFYSSGVFSWGMERLNFNLGDDVIVHIVQMKIDFPNLGGLVLKFKRDADMEPIVKKLGFAADSIPGHVPPSLGKVGSFVWPIGTTHRGTMTNSWSDPTLNWNLTVYQVNLLFKWDKIDKNWFEDKNSILVIYPTNGYKMMGFNLDPNTKIFVLRMDYTTLSCAGKCLFISSLIGGQFGPWFFKGNIWNTDKKWINGLGMIDLGVTSKIRYYQVIVGEAGFASGQPCQES